FPNGMIFRNLEIPPEPSDPDEHRKVFAELNKKVGQKIEPTAEESQRHPTMHRTNTLDCITCVIGEVYLITDVDEVLMRPGDTVIMRGTNQAWANRSDSPCLLSGSMIDAIPQGESS